MTVITYRVTLLEPTLVTALDGDPNSAVSFKYLPGSVLRGVMIGKYLQTLNPPLPTKDVGTDATVRRLFFDGTNRYLNAYLLEDDPDKQLAARRRGLPTPLSWYQEKGSDERQIADFAVDPSRGDKEQWKRVGTPFWATHNGNDGAEANLFAPLRHVSVHTARTRRFGRAMPERTRSGRRLDPAKGDTPGAVYRYDALMPGQTFEAAIICDTAADAATLKGYLDGEVTLGGSRSGGYGRARLHDAEEVADGWREVRGSLRDSFDGKLIVTLLSDVLLRDKCGQFAVSSTVITEALEKQMGLPGGTLKLRKDWPAFISSEAIGGFNRKWGLPLPQALAVKMGSVLVYDAPPGIDTAKLQLLEESGIGERRAEGFGRIAVNWHTDKLIGVYEKKEPPTSPPANEVRGGKAIGLAEGMAKRMLRKRLDERVMAAAAKVNINRAPTNAQLSRLRAVIYDELMKTEPKLECIGKFLSGLASTARKQFEQAQVSNRRLTDWLTFVSGLTDPWNSLFELKEEKDRRQEIGSNISVELTDDLRIEYILRYVDAVLSRAAKTRGGEE